MTRLLLPLLALGCSSPLASRALAERHAQHFFEMQPEGGEAHAQLTTGALGLQWSSLSFGTGSPDVLRAVADRLEGCGQAPEDLLDVRVLATAGGWPWEVELREVTPGAETCVEAVLSRIALDADLWSGKRYLAARVRVATLKAPKPPPPLRPCLLIRPMEGFPGSTTRVGVPARRADDVAASLSCAGDEPLTRLWVVYRRGELVEVGTEPPVACVEEAARRELADPTALEVGAWDEHDLPERISAWDELRCAFDVPVAPR